ncbi:hypothetical protein GCK72_014448 [Caenorhabditis remanei]|uniref:CRE-FLP-9 protein n=2 Tax=Caenorhabditis remanei TaxID=31234 RepID=E3M6I5_CAERE|nr:hypothetical protein GCK72_014448 [Caenorhabditis remanei]EFO93211.1 CRE-FLP-9 protein [Caenorhabditis remanei]KAF1757990.1 hypothetical protein GCK72_014448 [Caenorhabditis remanei]
MSQLYALLLIACIASVATAFQEPDLDALAEFCGKESNRKYCDQIAQLATQHAMDVNQEQVQMMEKRKPSFVRFGKRSGYPLIIDGEEMRMDKRKPSFVRFGRK